MFSIEILYDLTSQVKYIVQNTIFEFSIQNKRMAFNYSKNNNKEIKEGRGKKKRTWQAKFQSLISIFFCETKSIENFFIGFVSIGKTLKY